MKKGILLSAAISIMAIVNTLAQNINLIPNPGNADVGYQSSSIVYNGNIYFQYGNSAGKYQLAKYDGSVVSLIANRDTADYGFQLYPILYNGNLYFQYRNASNKSLLAKYDGSTLSLIPNFNSADLGFQSDPIVYNGNLYFQYTDQSGRSHLAKYDGSSISLIANPDSTDSGCQGKPVIYNGNLYFQYAVNVYSQHYLLAKFDGSVISLISNPNNADLGYWGNPIVCNGYLYFQYCDIFSYPTEKFQLARYDGSAISLIANANTVDVGFVGYPVIYNGNLYFQYENASGNLHRQLAKYDGSTLHLVPNFRGLDDGFQYYPIVYNGNLYFDYLASGYSNLVKYDGSTLSQIPNLNYSDHGPAGPPIEYNGSLYFCYLTNSAGTRYQLAKYNDSIISLIANVDTADRGIYQNEPIRALNGALCFRYSRASGLIRQLARFTNCINTSSSTSVSVCASALPYQHGTHRMTAAGSDTIHLTNAAGCDSAMVLVLTVIPTATDTITATITSPATYTVGTHSFGSTGSYTVTMPGAAVNGCDSIVTLHLTVNGTACTPSVSVTCNNTNLDVTSTRIMTATAVNGGTRPVYMWYKNGSLISGAMNSVLSYGGALGNGDQIYCTMTPANGCAASQTATSNVVTFTRSGSGTKDITTFTMPAQVGTSVINTTNATVSAVVTTAPALRTAIHPIRITVSLNAAYGPSYIINRDFSMPVTYTVRAQDGSTRVWTVTVVDQSGNKTSSDNLNIPTDMTVYPDPAADYINVQATGGADAPVITILDMEGRVMYNQALPVTDIINHQVDLSDFAAGSYIIYVALGEKVQSRQFVVGK